jgi:hypothetical protein
MSSKKKATVQGKIGRKEIHTEPIGGLKLGGQEASAFFLT